MKRPPSAMQAYADKLAEYLAAGKSGMQCAAENQELRFAALAEWQYNLAVKTQDSPKGKVYFV